MDSYIKLEKAIKKLSDIPDELIKQLSSICREQVIKKGEYFICAGEFPKQMGFILEGLFRLYYMDEDGNEYTKAFSRTGQFLISYSAIVQKRPSFFYIEALQDSLILKFNYEIFDEMLQTDIRWYPFAYKLLENVYIMKELREKSFLLDNATKRYQDFKEHYADVEGQIKLYHVASFLGITPEALSRLRKNNN
jgi:CRP-like cAMP-binding protein